MVKSSHSRQAGGADRTGKRRLSLFFLKWTAVFAIWGAVLGAVVIGFFAWDLPRIDDALNAVRRPSVTILAADGSEIGRFGDIRGAAVQVGELPRHLAQAVVATEDRRFYRHFGVDLFGIARAFIVNIKAGRIRQGGSTITQQAAKNLFLNPERTIRRKVQEVLLALWLESRFSKDQILTIYLNRVYLGAGTYGVEAAARKYFDVSARRLDLHQSAVLAGLLKAPSRLSPATNPEGARKRARVVLANMVAAGYLTNDAAARAGEGLVDLRRAPAQGRIARYFADWVQEQLPGYLGPLPGDVVVRTTLDRRLQRAAEIHLRRFLDREGAAARIGDGAVLILSPDGAVRAMVGGRDYGTSQFNRAVQALRQPGSAFKPIVFLAALEAGIRPDSRFQDAPLDIGGWKPRNHDGKYLGPVTAAEALARSVNTVAVRVSEKTGREAVIRKAKRLGFSGDFQPHPSLALGVAEVSLLELTQAYGAIANGGQGVWAYGISEVKGADGRVLYQRQGGGPGRVMKARDAALMSTMMSNVITEGTGQRARLGRPAAGKTGTSQEFRDAWFVGFTADLVAGVWLGNDNGRSMKRVTGGGAPAILWRQIMTDAHQGKPARALAAAPLPAAPAEVEAAAEEKPSLFQRILRSIRGGD